MARQVSLRGKRRSAFENPSSCRTTSIRSAASPRSSTLKLGCSPTRLQWRRISRFAIEWKVPDHGRRTCIASSPTMRCARRVISIAARRLKVRSRMRCGFAPSRMRCATRCASVLVLPVPAPAMISSGPPPKHAAARCAGFSFLNLSATSTRATILYIHPGAEIGVRPRSISLLSFAFPMRPVFDSERLKGIRRGIEKESLRVNLDGTLAQTPHPKALGSPLTHPHITTDFSEAQLELITSPHPSVDTCLEELTHIHQVVYRHIGDEV